MSLIKTLLKEIQSEDMTTLYHYSEVDDVEIEYSLICSGYIDVPKHRYSVTH